MANVEGIELSSSTRRIVIGSSHQLKATIFPSNATNKNVNWSTSNASVAMVTTTGLVDIGSMGSATITARAAGNTARTATCAVTARPVPNLPLSGYGHGANCIGSYGGSTGCDAFARYVYNQVYGINPPFLSTLPVHDVQLTTSNLHNRLQEWGNYSYVRGFTANGIVHSVFIVSFTSSRVTVYHSNYSPAGKVSYEQNLTYAEFLQRLNKYTTHF